MYGHSWPFAAVHDLSCHSMLDACKSLGEDRNKFLSFVSQQTLGTLESFPVSDISHIHLLDRIHENRSQRCKTNQSLRTAASPASVGKCSACGWCEMIVESRWVVHGSWLVHAVIYVWI